MPTSAVHENPRKKRLAIKVGIAVVLVCLLVGTLSVLLMPTFRADATYTIREAYDLPDDSVEVVVLGASTLHRAFSPDYAYEHYGINSFNSGSNAQPPIASYYLLKDLENSQRGSLKVVLLDASTLVNTGDFFTSSVGAERVAGCMSPSLNKLEYLWAVSQEYDDVQFFELLIPVLRYHDRWEELEDDDFAYNSLVAQSGHFHGQPLFPSTLWSNVTQGNAGSYGREKNLTITQEIEDDPADLRADWVDLSARYIDRIALFCSENDLELVLVKTPEANWGDRQHDSVAQFAKERGLEFLDMTLPEIWDSCDLSYDTDFNDDKHPNLSGSMKLTKYLGESLLHCYSLSDDRLEESGGFTSEDLEMFSQTVEDSNLSSCTSLTEYLDLINRDRYTVFISVRGEAAEGIGEEQRAMFESMGLEKLSNLIPNQSYIGILSGGEVLLEKVGEDGSKIEQQGSFDGEKVLTRKTNMQPNAQLEDSLTLASTGKDSGANATIKIRGGQKAENKRGINFVIYNHETGCMIDTSSFDTHLGLKRTSDLVQ